MVTTLATVTAAAIGAAAVKHYNKIGIKSMNGPVQQTLETKLAQLEPQTLIVENVSHQHSGHAGSPGTGESHFNVKIVSSKFDGLSRVARHKLVYSILKDELAGPVHALALETHSAEEALK